MFGLRFVVLTGRSPGDGDVASIESSGSPG
jgi:hypothetical protein